MKDSTLKTVWKFWPSKILGGIVNSKPSSTCWVTSHCLNSLASSGVASPLAPSMSKRWSAVTSMLPKAVLSRTRSRCPRCLAALTTLTWVLQGPSRMSPPLGRRRAACTHYPPGRMKDTYEGKQCEFESLAGLDTHEMDLTLVDALRYEAPSQLRPSP